MFGGTYDAPYRNGWRIFHSWAMWDHIIYPQDISRGVE